MTGNAPTSGNVYGNERRESGSRRNQQSREEEGSDEKKEGSRREGYGSCRKTKELQFFILEEESNKKA